MGDSVRVNPDDLYLWGTGEAQQAYQTFGCHFIEEKNCHQFVLWAPGARSCAVVGDFNGWDETRNPMAPEEGGVFTAQIKGLKTGDLYKFFIVGRDGSRLLKADPFARYSELRPGTASRVWSDETYTWGDSEYIKRREKQDIFTSPMSIYELHAGSWKRHEDGSYYTYRELADALADYVTEMGFTHVELMPITEYPLDMSWGYQVTGYFSPTARYGTPDDFRYFVDTLHQAGIGVILDWVPAHFPKDAHGLAKFDGGPLYEYENPLMGEQPQWGTLIFDYGKPQVQSFLISSAIFFVREMHIDGIRIDAVSSMLYLNFGKEDGQYIPNDEGGTTNKEAVAFLQKLNTAILGSFPGTVTIAEESSAFPLVTMPPKLGGLGFSMKWNMGFMHDTLEYMEMDHLFRRDNHNKLTFSMSYAFSENYVLPYSHDEVVHGKRSMIDKMFGSYEEKFAALRTLYAFVYGHPGKKLLFMGSEFAQFIEWDYKKELDWFLDEYDSHMGMKRYVAALNRVYKENPALFEIENSWDGFDWLQVDDNLHSVFAFTRKPKTRKTGKQPPEIICVYNFTPVARERYALDIKQAGRLKLIMSSDGRRFGGGECPVVEDLIVEDIALSDSATVHLDLPPLTALYYEFTPTLKPKREKSKTGGKKNDH